MGYFSNEHVAKFCIGKTIESLEVTDDDFYTKINFTDGTGLKFYIFQPQPKVIQNYANAKESYIKIPQSEIIVTLIP